MPDGPLEAATERNSPELAPTLPSTKEAPGSHPSASSLPLVFYLHTAKWTFCVVCTAKNHSTRTGNHPLHIRTLTTQTLPSPLTPGNHRSVLSSAAIVLFLHTCYINGIIQYITSETHFLLSFSIVPLRPIRLVCMDGPFLLAGEWYSRMSTYQFVSPITH